MRRLKTLTPDQRHAIATQPLPHLPSVVYTGKIWGGVQITDTVLQEQAENILLEGYDGLYGDLLLELEELNALTPFNEMVTTDYERRERT